MSALRTTRKTLTGFCRDSKNGVWTRTLKPLKFFSPRPKSVASSCSSQPNSWPSSRSRACRRIQPPASTASNCLPTTPTPSMVMSQRRWSTSTTVFLRNTVVDVDQRRCDITIDGVGVVGRQLLAVLAGGWILRHARLLELGHEFGWLEQLDATLLGRGEKNFKGFNVRVQTPFFESRQNPVSVFLVVRRADMMRAR